MTNFEKYKEKIAKIVRNDKFISLNKNTRVLGECGSISCYNCRFLGNCAIEALEWLYEEYQEPAPKLTKKERAFCEIVRHGYIARDENGSIACHFPEPQKNIPRHSWHNFYNYKIFLDENSFSFIEWKDEKPWSIEDLLKLEVCDD